MKSRMKTPSPPGDAAHEELKKIDEILTSIVFKRLEVSLGDEQYLRDHVEWCVNEFLKGRFES